MARRRPIVHPTDFSKGADAAFGRALEAARKDGAPLIVVHVLAPVLNFSEETSAARWMEMQKAVKDAARERIDRRLARARKAGVRARDLLLEGGWTPDQIVRAAKARRAGLIVMGTHGRTGLRKLIAGSVASRVIAMAPCPVLVVRMKASGR